MNQFQVRYARLQDQSLISTLIQSSVRKLATGSYSQAQIEQALLSAWGLDSQLIKDRTYYVVYSNQTLAGCGGWSYRKTLFGNDQESNRDPEMLDPLKDPAKIRAFFVEPQYARQGVATLILQTCESAAINAGFSRLELMSTLPGMPFYRDQGFVPEPLIEYPLSDDLSIEFVPMSKTLDR